MEQWQYQLDLLTALNDKMANNEKMYQKICDISSNAYIYLDFQTNLGRSAGNWEHFFDFSFQDMKDVTKVLESVEELYAVPLREALYPEKQNRETALTECLHRNGKTWMEFSAVVYYDQAHKPMEKIIQIKDITKSRFQQGELEYLAYFDSLTDLYNRNYFVRSLSKWLKKAEETNTVISVMFLDIDDFRKINDGLGLIVGDELVQVFGQFLKEFQDEDVMVSHFSSDTFCIAVNEPGRQKSPDYFAKKIHDRTQSPFSLTSKHELVISVSIGVAEYPEAAVTALELINCAEIVMFKAKSAGRGNLQYFDAPILSEFLNAVSIEHDLKDAVLSKRFTLCFQPQFDSAAGRLRGVEALIRWKDQEGQPVSPAVFIPIAEKNGTIIPIGNWVMEESVRIFSEWQKKFRYPLILSINISAIQYKRSDFVTKLISILNKYSVPPQSIELEITESVLIDDLQDVIEKMYRLRELGIRVSLDDFGTGYSSLSYLKGLPIDTLKIDKSFVDTVTSDSSTRIIMESIIGMVKKLGFETVAEGVETREQFEYLKTINCDNIQGFYLGKPMQAKEIELLLMKALGE